MLKQCTSILIPGLVLGLALTLPAQADELIDGAQKLCEKVQTCAIAQMGEQNLTPQMRQMMQPMLDNMCATMRKQVAEVPPDDALYKPALACMQSMQSLTCEFMENPDLASTAECKAYEELAEQRAEQP